ncbi:MAG: ATP-dependent DNA ligase [Rhodoglobus sp.]
MGFPYYGNNSYAVEIDDRALAHLKVAMLTLLRAGKCLAFCFDRSADIGSGRETLWISPSTEIRFLFRGSRVPTINHEWLRRIIATADAPTGLRLVPEPQEMPVLIRSAG